MKFATPAGIAPCPMGRHRPAQLEHTACQAPLTAQCVQLDTGVPPQPQHHKFALLETGHLLDPVNATAAMLAWCVGWVLLMLETAPYAQRVISALVVLLVNPIVLQALGVTPLGWSPQINVSHVRKVTIAQPAPVTGQPTFARQVTGVRLVRPLQHRSHAPSEHSVQRRDKYPRIHVCRALWGIIVRVQGSLLPPMFAR